MTLTIPKELYNWMKQNNCFDQWYINCKEYMLTHGNADILISRIKNNLDNGIYHAIFWFAFEWSKTTQGEVYWRALNEQLQLDFNIQKRLH